MNRRHHLCITLALLAAASLASAQTLVDIDVLELAKSGSLHDMQEAITLGADVNARDAYARDYAFTTPLMYAIENNRPPEIIAILRQASANVTNRY